MTQGQNLRGREPRSYVVSFVTFREDGRDSFGHFVFVPTPDLQTDDDIVLEIIRRAGEQVAVAGLPADQPPTILSISLIPRHDAVVDI